MCSMTHIIYASGAGDNKIVVSRMGGGGGDSVVVPRKN